MPNKSVRFSTLTVYEFGVGLGGSSVPKRGGPSIGLAKKPQSVWSTRVEDIEAMGCDLHYFALAKQQQQEQSSELQSQAEQEQVASEMEKQPEVMQKKCKPKKSVSCKCCQTRQRRRVRWLKPLERVVMLTKAGYSEDRIVRMIMEASDIAMSRRLTLAMDRS